MAPNPPMVRVSRTSALAASWVAVAGAGVWLLCGLAGAFSVAGDVGAIPIPASASDWVSLAGAGDSTAGAWAWGDSTTGADASGGVGWGAAGASVMAVAAVSVGMVSFQPGWMRLGSVRCWPPSWTVLVEAAKISSACAASPSSSWAIPLRVSPGATVWVSAAGAATVASAGRFSVHPGSIQCSWVSVRPSGWILS